MTTYSKFPAGQIKSITGTCIYLKGNDIDTDRIIPARFLKCIDFEALANQVFADDRIEATGSHPFDQSNNKNASILVVGNNFGCGSSREHAPQALMRWGIRGIIGQSFAEIFYGNCLSIGIPCATISENNIRLVIEAIENTPNMEFEFNINDKRLYFKDKFMPIQLEPEALEMLLSGEWDVTSSLLNKINAIDLKIKKLPYLNNFKSE
ncbi:MULTISPECIES: 3-isopropylmalate dehydratase small subunit [Prochlorococcus]|uniref:3-isopropylmalate dehydratase n=1 Tax=Prochlorococcus marinus (strain SARG / CCMP1375 / SS120) TaxID=167539 RepID=Q7VDT1_PROMA|nr:MULTISPECIES: 3-isopropylmalate dehydratase small subunit [Prochlorococcus]AAP99333.1 3-isopropylmalate dehydratase small subunit [Prochlorococcus marinus subsp. marinus str. CCMP1375]KGG11396.1 3-isopropylmalate dehydratase small subunit [Prochlorococcus marinus str. LG]KGG18648.1 3-isopropylmalate dehydratase small subunit [Prochlorococcus marinus str. SS2]KGG22921.1 3-isopropylmalate dehydratase small subunit [Prochlorococcus marinus str. SS35]KGG34025.1 3-isopropylmalate dehydratase sma